MKLIIHELTTGVALQQKVTCEQNTIVEAIRPHIYRHNFPDGNLKVQIYNGLSLVAESELVAISDIGSMDFYHGYIRFYINAYLKANQEYTIKLVGDVDYVFGESAYCGWINGFDLRKYPFTWSPTNSLGYPLDFEIWERTVK